MEDRLVLREAAADRIEGCLMARYCFYYPSKLRVIYNKEVIL